MKLIIGSDHAGFELKEYIIEHLKSCGHQVLDTGCYNKNSCDYPDIAKFVCRKFIIKGDFTFGILVCGTGIGMSMCANKYHSEIRCAVCNDTTSTEMTRKHNDANFISLGAKIVSKTKAKELLGIFINTKFEGGRHQNRIDKLSN